MNQSQVVGGQRRQIAQLGVVLADLVRRDQIDVLGCRGGPATVGQEVVLDAVAGNLQYGRAHRVGPGRS